MKRRALHLWLALGLAAASLGVAGWWWRTRASTPAATLAPTPDAGAAVQPTADDPIDTAVAAMVRRFVLELAHSDDDRDDLLQRLDREPARAAVHALKILEDAATQPTLLRERTSTRWSGLPQTPAQRACELLANHPLPAAIPRLQTLLGAVHDGTRKTAALALGRTGDPAAVEGLRLALGDRDEYVRSYAGIGLERAEKAGQLASTTRQQLVAPLLDAAIANEDDHLLALATRWDPDGALARLRAVHALSANTPPRTLRFALAALTGAGLLLPRAELLALWQQRPSGDDDPLPQCRAAIFTMLERHGDPADEALLQELLLGSGEEASAAANAWMRRLGLADLNDRLHRKQFKTREPFSPAELRHDAMWMLDAEVGNGGFDQYFSNSSGDDWQAALAGFDAFDAPRAALLREVVAAFDSPPSIRRSARGLQLVALNSKRADALAAFDKRYYALPTPILVTIARHAAAHVEELRR
jgi:HEAT repeat protein